MARRVALRLVSFIAGGNAGGVGGGLTSSGRVRVDEEHRDGTQRACRLIIIRDRAGGVRIR